MSSRPAVATLIPAISSRARSLSPARSSMPMTGSASQTSATDREFTNALPNSPMTWNERVAGRETGGDRGGGDDEERVDAKGETNNDDGDADEGKHPPDP